MAWMAAASALAALGVLLRHVAPAEAGVLLGQSATLIALGCVWAACRSLGARPVAPAVLLSLPLLWVMFCALPAAMDDVALRIRMATLASALIGLGALAELQRQGRSRPPGRKWIGGLLALQALTNLMRAVSPPVRPDEAAADEWTLLGVIVLSLAMAALLRDERRALGLGPATRTRDAATGLGNRRAFEAALAGAFGRASRAGTHVALVLVEIARPGDRTDERGDDAPLRALTRAIRETLYRKADLAFRYGDDEFAILLPGTDGAAATLVAERVRRGFGDGAHGASRLSTTVAAMRPAAEDVPYDLLRQADRARADDRAMPTAPLSATD